MTLLTVTALDLPKRLKAARLMADLEQADIAAAIGVARQTVSNWERGVSEPSATFFVRWAAATGQPLEWLAEGVSVRPEGFEPPTYCSVADALRTCGAVREGTLGYQRCCLVAGHTGPHRSQDLGSWSAEWNRPCPMCGAPLVWGVCRAPHDAARVVWELAA